MTETPFLLTLAGFKESALKAIDEQRLAIQHPDELETFVDKNGSYGSCFNIYPPEYFGGAICNCIIGSAIPPKMSEEFVDDDLLNLLARGSVMVDKETTRKTLWMLQTQHDKLVGDITVIDRSEWDQRAKHFISGIRNLDTVEPV